MIEPAPSHLLVQAFFLRLLGAIYLIAFLSLLVQVRGLYGRRGVLPMVELAAAFRQLLGRRERLRMFPSLFWLGCSDRVLVGAAALGAGFAVLLVAGIAPVIMLLGLWALYLSFVALGREFLSYQWDALLLEAGFMAICFALATPPPLFAIWGWRLFLFRFLFSAGVVKLRSGDAAWRNLTALHYHYQTQPLPNRGGWYAHHLPSGAQKFSVLATYFFELAVPFLFFAPAPFRLTGFWLSVFFQTVIMATGSYGFFNLLTIVLCIPLLDDRHLVFLAGSLPAAGSSFPGSNLLVAGIFSFFVVVNLLQLLALFSSRLRPLRLLETLASLRLTSPYGLFAVMTTVRYEYVVEGSNDGREWLPYEFRYKPGDPRRAPPQAAPHQPRLDWQMWFAALRPDRVEPWLQELMRRLLEGVPEVAALLRTNPFSGQPPTYLRLTVFRYRFASCEARRRESVWWEREMIGRSPVISL